MILTIADLDRISSPIWPSDMQNQLIHADCADILHRFADKSFGLVLTDPIWPNTTVGSIDLPGRHNFPEIFKKVCTEFPRLTDRVIIHYGQTSDPRALTAIPASMPFLQTCWLRFVPPVYKGPILYSADVAYVFGHTQLPGDGSRVFGSECCSVWKKNDPNNPRRRKDNPHPTPRSLHHVSWLVRRFSRPGDYILDPFCGSGTTCLAALLAGRKFIGIDIELKFLKFAKRITNDPDLFLDKVITPDRNDSIGGNLKKIEVTG